MQARTLLVHDHFGELHHGGDHQDEAQRAQVAEAQRLQQPVVHQPRQRRRQRQHEAGGQRHAVGRVQLLRHAHERAQPKELGQHEVVDQDGANQQ